MARHIAKVAPRRASWALLRVVLQQAHLIDAEAADAIARTHLRHKVTDLAASNSSAIASDAAFSTALYAGMAIITETNARREGLPPMTKLEFDLLCHCVITCETLRDVIERGALFMHALACRPARMSLEVEDGIAHFRIETSYLQRDMLGLLTDLFGLAAHHRIFSWLIDAPIELRSVHMCYPPLVESAATAFMIPFPISYQAEANGLCFPARFLELPVVRTPQQLNRLLAHFPFDVDDTRMARDTLCNRVRSLMSAALSQGERLPSETMVADQLGISLSTLKRRLKAEDTSYRSIRDTLLCAVAIRSLKTDNQSIGSIANKLGFSDVSSFRNAFKRWTGSAPGKIGRQAIAEHP